jgi:hypothetical protein
MVLRSSSEGLAFLVSKISISHLIKDTSDHNKGPACSLRFRKKEKKKKKKSGDFTLATDKRKPRELIRFVTWFGNR